MFIRNDYPILEFDDNRDAKLRIPLERNSQSALAVRLSAPNRKFIS